MMLRIPDFDYRRVKGEVELNAAIGGSGEPVVLLHGFPADAPDVGGTWRLISPAITPSYVPTSATPSSTATGTSSTPAPAPWRTSHESIVGRTSKKATLDRHGTGLSKEPSTNLAIRAPVLRQSFSWAGGFQRCLADSRCPPIAASME
jgi:hypothetical protein